jgi:hypothetical protein
LLKDLKDGPWDSAFVFNDVDDIAGMLQDLLSQKFLESVVNSRPITELSG